jgi:CheY-like chemotaxis protein
MAALLLVVEDDPDLRDALCLLLGHAGYEVLAASTVEEAGARLSPAAVVGAILLRERLRAPEGRTPLERLAGLPSLRCCPVILLACGDRSLPSAAAPVVASLRMPFEPDALLDVVAGVAAGGVRALAR